MQTLEALLALIGVTVAVGVASVIWQGISLASQDSPLKRQLQVIREMHERQQ